MNGPCSYAVGKEELRNLPLLPSVETNIYTIITEMIHIWVLHLVTVHTLQTFTFMNSPPLDIVTNVCNCRLEMIMICEHVHTDEPTELIPSISFLSLL